MPSGSPVPIEKSSVVRVIARVCAPSRNAIDTVSGLVKVPRDAGTLIDCLLETAVDTIDVKACKLHISEAASHHTHATWCCLGTDVRGRAKFTDIGRSPLVDHHQAALL